MGYACPVCEEPQVDAEHLANHLAFTAILRGGDHEAWLDEQVPDWSEQSPAELGPAVAKHAEEVELDVSETEVPDPDAGAAGDRGHGLDGRSEAGMGAGARAGEGTGAGAGEGTGAGAREGTGAGAREGKESRIGAGARRGPDRLSAEDRAVLEEARELTRKMLEADAAEAESAEAESASDEADAESFTERDPEAESASEGDGEADEADSTAASEESEKE